MTSAAFHFEPLGGQHDRKSFRCGEDALDRYLQTQATQDIRRNIANCFVAVETATGQVGGYYTLSGASVALVDLPPEETKHLPRYPTVPAVRIGRLAVDETFHGRGLGATMLMDAANRTMRADAAAIAILVDAKNDQAVAFYERHGFCAVVDQPRALFLPIAAIKKALTQKRS
jgi:ribosomal protein S18 acetylase RimI-like enzyme